MLNDTHKSNSPVVEKEVSGQREVQAKEEGGQAKLTDYLTVVGVGLGVTLAGLGYTAWSDPAVALRLASMFS